MNEEELKDHYATVRNLQVGAVIDIEGEYDNKDEQKEKEQQEKEQREKEELKAEVERVIRGELS